MSTVALPPNAAPARSRGWLVLGVALLMLAAIARIANLDADPYFNDWIGPVTDEGRWVEAARNLALFGEPGLYQLSRMHLLLSPGFQAVAWVVFKLFGVSTALARLFPAVAAVALLLSWLTLRRHLCGSAWVLGAAVLGLDATLFNLSRVALPEIPALLFSQAAFLVLLFGGGRTRRAAIAGVLLLLALTMKLTTLFAVPAFVAVAVAAAWHRPVRERVRSALALLAPMTVCAVLAVAAVLSVVRLDMHLLRSTIGQVSGFVQLVSAYDLADRLVNAQPGTLLLLLLGAWCTSWIWVCRDEWRDSAAGRLYLLSGLWAAGWLLAWGLMAYVPKRYTVHAVVPLLMHVLAGFSVVGSLGTQRLAQRFAEFARARPPLAALWLVLPTAYITAALLMALGESLGWLGDRRSTRIAALAVVSALLVVIVLPRVTRPRWSIAVATVPALAAALWGGAEIIAWIGGPKLEPVGADNWGFGAFVLAAVLSAALARDALRPVAAAAAAITVVALFGQQLPYWLQPTHLGRDCSRRIAHLIPSSPLRIRSFKAGSMFLETRLRYVDQWTTGEVQADAVVQYFPDAATKNVARFQPPGDDYASMLRCPMPVHPHYPTADVSRTVEVVVYGRRDVPALAALMPPP